ncbi:MAG: adenylyl-sulfate reductase [Gammaproteobacteria bacterium]|jgi:small-conductance mechanosensitive channel|nr:adenylyl-sulfate reductase [Gammaproteobacteria bacterium]MBV04082.1 adenylyl-sulfate reductase [Paracoccaceae bacterium]MBT5644625.1 adenylyl-sulfate reductase [Gammaproteobacteria bacterium]MBT5863461.1 adenylyl-sulfate reductase [Gammaproteobacteria bacterium]MBT6733892.1 adenylyl-sulfate reductase [Gammaproteobacteria bacterium]|tara:strand:- start:986 stop:1768 length:783 start_codon:yes stop_codon:yes gene_type:complete
MITTNPFAENVLNIPSYAIQGFLILMVVFTIGGVILDMMHKKNVKFFFQNAKKMKLAATNSVSTGEKVSIVVKTLAHDVATSAEFCGVTRRITHLLGMYGTIIFWVASAVMIFNTSTTSTIYPMLWHIGAIMTCVGGYWFWFIQRVDVRAEGNSWSRIVFADLFVLSLVGTSTLGLLWSYFQSANSIGFATLFFVMFIISNVILFGGVYWSKFAHMFYKPGAAIQKHLAEADGSRDDLPAPADLPKQFGLGIKRSEPQNY